MTTLVVVLLGFLIVAGALVSVGPGSGSRARTDRRRIPSSSVGRASPDSAWVTT
jgi:hypothetical protein